MRLPRLATPLSSLLLVAGFLTGCASSRPAPAAAVPSGWPVPPGKARISSAFGDRRGRSIHQGIDLSAAHDTPVRATADGRVSFAGRSGPYGRLVVVDHGGGWETRYAHLHRLDVRDGDRVRRGHRLGTVGRSGNATGDHLHYEVRHNGVPIDPTPTLAVR